MLGLIFSLSVLLQSAFAQSLDIPVVHNCFNNRGGFGTTAGGAYITLEKGFYIFNPSIPYEIKKNILPSIGVTNRTLQLYTKGFQTLIKVPAKDCISNTFASRKTEIFSCKTTNAVMALSAPVVGEAKPDVYTVKKVSLVYSTKRSKHEGYDSVSAQFGVVYPTDNKASVSVEMDLSFQAVLESFYEIEYSGPLKASGCEVQNEYGMTLVIKSSNRPEIQ